MKVELPEPRMGWIGVGEESRMTIEFVPVHGSLGGLGFGWRGRGTY